MSVLLVASFMTFSTFSWISFKRCSPIIPTIQEMLNLNLPIPKKFLNDKFLSYQTIKNGQVISLVTDFIVVLVTAKDKEQAEKISKTLLAEKLVACANIISPVSSLFLWQGKVDRAEECILIMKTRKSLFGELQLCVKALHSYEVPEILALPIVDGSENYLSWMGSVIRQ